MVWLFFSRDVWAVRPQVVHRCTKH